MFNKNAFNEDKNKTEKMKNKIASEDLNEYKDIKDIKYLFNEITFNENIYEGIMDIRYFSDEKYYIGNIKSEFNKLFNNLVKTYTEDIRYMVDYINNGEKLEKRPINLEDVRDKFIAYRYNSHFGILSKSSYIDLKNEYCFFCYI